MERDNQAGRMLFTDFDASEKGRPDPASPRDKTPFFPTLPDIDDLAASLDLDFEDDAEPPPEPPEENEERNDEETENSPPEPPTASSFFANDDNRADDDALPSAVPTWSDLAQSFKQNSPETAAALFFHTVRPGEFAHDTPPPPVQPQPSPLDDEEEDFVGETLAEDVFADATEDEEMDVLSLLPPSADKERGEDDEDAVYKPFAGEWRGHRLGLRPPRSIPYGGIKRLEQWYRPPEEGEAAEEGFPKKADDWFEPPEWQDSRRATRLIPSPDATEADQPQMLRETLRDEKEAESATAVPDSSEQRKKSSTTSTVDIFAGVDLEKVWREKLDRPAKSPGRPGDSRSIDMFENVDLESAWEEKLRNFDPGLLAEEKGNIGRPDLGASTVVMSSGILDNQATVIMPSAGSNLPDLPEPAPPEKPRKSERRKRKKAPPIAASLVASDEALGFLDDLGDFFPDDAEKATEPKPGKKRAGDLPNTLEELEIGDLVSIADEEEAKSGDAGNGMPKADAEPPPTAADETGADEEDYIPSGNVVDGGEHASAEVVDADAPATGHAPVTADDVIEQVAFDSQPTEDDAVEAPVVDDSIIDTEVRNVGPDVDELLSMIEGEDAVEGGGDEADAAEVAVDPMAALSGLDDMNFSDDGDMLDDEVKAMLAEDAMGEAMSEEKSGAGGKAASAAAKAVPAPPATRFGKAVHFARGLAGRMVPGRLLKRLNTLIAWRENWWFYCDLLAAVIASASLAVIFSYYFWYR